jgi:hypothetical protein
MSIQDILNQLKLLYRRPSGLQLLQHNVLFRLPFCATEALERLFCGIEQCQEIQVIADNLYTPMQLMANTVQLLMASGIFPMREFEDWEATVNKLYTALKNMFTYLDPNETASTLATSKINDDTTVVTSNCSSLDCVIPHRPQMQGWATAARALFGPTSHKALNVITIATTHAIADTGTTSIFIMDGINVGNKQTALKPLTISLSDGRRVLSTHVCDIAIHGLPTVLTRHIVLDLAIASLVGIRPLCKVGC